MAKKLADRMYDIYAGVHLLEEAQYDIKHDGDGRKVFVAEQWDRMTFNQSADKGIRSNYCISDKVFDSLVCFEKADI